MNAQREERARRPEPCSWCPCPAFGLECKSAAAPAVHEDDTPQPQTAPALTLRAVQSAAWQNKLAKGFNTTDVPLEFGLLTAEVGEAFTAWRKGLPDFGEELADVLLYLVAIAEMTGVDLGLEVEKKHAKNQARTYRRAANGVLIKTEGATT